MAGEVISPRAMPHAPRGAYRCLECNQPVHVKKGEVRRHHFAHYPEDRAIREQQGHTCKPESVEHQAAKIALQELFMKAHVTSVHVSLPCQGVSNPTSLINECAGRVSQVFDVPEYDSVCVEYTFGTAGRLDVALLRDEQVVLGIEVLQSHRVDPPKARELNVSGVPWFEINAHELPEKPSVWTVQRTHLPAVRCPACEEHEQVFLQQVALRSPALPQKLRLQLKLWTFLPFAHDATRLYTPSEAHPSMSYRCLVCGQALYRTREGGAFGHATKTDCTGQQALALAPLFCVKQAALRGAPFIFKGRCTSCGEDGGIFEFNVPADALFRRYDGDAIVVRTHEQPHKCLAIIRPGDPREGSHADRNYRVSRDLLLRRGPRWPAPPDMPLECPTCESKRTGRPITIPIPGDPFLHDTTTDYHYRQRYWYALAFIKRFMGGPGNLKIDVSLHECTNADCKQLLVVFDATTLRSIPPHLNQVLAYQDTTDRMGSRQRVIREICPFCGANTPLPSTLDDQGVQLNQRDLARWQREYHKLGLL